ncbi:MAG: M24 family metallopeptidase [Candidatus Levyibacteriota bacterium]
MIKTKSEIKKIERACQVTDETFDHILKKIKVGISERQVSLEIQRFIKKFGAKLSFRPIIAFGKNSANPHHKPNNTILKNGDFIKLDFGAKVDDYCSDMTRTVFMGKASRRQKKIYQTVLAAQKKAINYLEWSHSEQSEESRMSARSLGLRPQDNIRGKDVDKAARDYVISKGYPSFPHGLGHGIGKKVHQKPKLSPKSKHFLKPGMVFSVEPGIYLRSFGGVRIEDTVVLEKTGLRILTKSTKRIIEL